MLIQEWGEKVKVRESWRNKKFKVEKIERGAGKGIDAWRYVKDIGRPILWPLCQELAKKDSNFLLMEDGAPAHRASYNNLERAKWGIRKAPWPSKSPDFNPIEHIWDWIRDQIAQRNDVGTEEGMKKALIAAWEDLSVQKINSEISQLPHIMAKCLSVNGSNNYHG